MTRMWAKMCAKNGAPRGGTAIMNSHRFRGSGVSPQPARVIHLGAAGRRSHEGSCPLTPFTDWFRCGCGLCQGFGTKKWRVETLTGFWPKACLFGGQELAVATWLAWFHTFSHDTQQSGNRLDETWTGILRPSVSRPVRSWPERCRIWTAVFLHFRLLTHWSYRDYSLTMKTVSVAALKSELSRYLRTVRGGSEIIVTTHDHAVAKLVPYTVNAGTTIRPPRLPREHLRGIKSVQTLKPCDPLVGLLEDRARR